MKKTVGIRSLLFACVLSCYFLVSADVSQLKEQEANLWTKLESSLLSTQSEIDGLQILVNNLQMDSQKLTNELTMSQADYNKLQLLLKSTDDSFNKLLNDYNLLKLKEQRLVRWLMVLSGIGVLLLVNNIVGTVLWAKGIKVPRLLEIWL